MTSGFGSAGSANHGQLGAAPAFKMFLIMSMVLFILHSTPMISLWFLSILFIIVVLSFQLRNIYANKTDNANKAPNALAIIVQNRDDSICSGMADRSHPSITRMKAIRYATKIKSIRTPRPIPSGSRTMTCVSSRILFTTFASTGGVKSVTWVSSRCPTSPELRWPGFALVRHRYAHVQPALQEDSRASV